MAATVFATAALRGQQSNAAASHPSHKELDLALTYAPERSIVTNGSGFWRQGGVLELSAEFYHGLGLAVNIAGSHAGNIHGAGVNLTTVTTTFGPRYTWTSNSRKLAVFGESLIGESNGLDSTFPTTTGARTGFDTFAVQVGSGVDLRFFRHFAIRPIQADWVHTQFPNGATNVQNDLRLGTGIVFRFLSKS